eukprot:4198395-Pyramimonas_sp.AAC.1
MERREALKVVTPQARRANEDGNGTRRSKMGSCTSASASSGALAVPEKLETRSQTEPTQGL